MLNFYSGNRGPVEHLKKTRIVGSVLVFAGAFFCGFQILHDDGIVGQTKKPLRAPLYQVKGCFCHNDTASQFVRTWIAGPETLTAGVEALYTVNVAKDSDIAAGFDVAAFFGDLGVYDSTSTQLMRIDPNNPIDSLELTHVFPKLAEGRDTISWSFWYKAPENPGLTDTIYAVGNSVDTSYDPSGDNWNFAPNFLVHIVNTAGVREQALAVSYRLFQNFPNPFNPSTTIKYQLTASNHVTLGVFDLVGHKVTSLVDEVQKPGDHFVKWDATGIASGVYLCRLQAGEFTATRKLLLLR